MSNGWRLDLRRAGARAIALVPLLAWAATVGSQPGVAQAQDVQRLLPWLELPSAWVRTVQEGVVAVVPDDLPPGASLLLLVEPPSIPEAALAADYLAALADLGPWTPIGEPVEAELPSGWAFRQGVGVAELDGVRYTALTAVARHGGRRVRFWVLADSDDTFNRYQTDIGNAIGSVQGLTLAPEPAPGTAAAAPAAAGASRLPAGFGAGVSGVYVGVERGLGAGAGAGGQELSLDLSTNEPDVRASPGAPQTQLTISDYEEVDVFFPDGTYRRRLPIRGLGSDLGWERAQQSALWGRWSRQGNQVIAQRGSYSAVYTVQGDDLVSDRGRLWRKLPPPSQARLDGSFAREDYRDATAPRLVLHPDGRYEDRGGFLRMVGSAWHLVVPDGDARLASWSQAEVDRAMAAGGGTYTFDAFTLTLSDGDGRVWRINAYLPPGETLPRPRRLVINGRPLVRD